MESDEIFFKLGAGSEQTGLLAHGAGNGNKGPDNPTSQLLPTIREGG